MKRFKLLAACACAALSTVPAAAAQIVYNFTGVFSGTFGSTSFVNELVAFTGIGDTATAAVLGTTIGDVTTVSLSSLVATVDGVAGFDFGSGFSFGTSNDFGAVGFGRVAGNDVQFLLATNLALSEGVYNGVTAFGPKLTAYLTSTTVTAPFGNATVTDAVDPIFFSAATTAAVPEPAAWAMMISGFGLIGGAMRRRVAKVTFQAA